MANNEKNIETLLRRVREDLGKIKAKYGASLESQEVSDDLRIDIKDLCGNLRSVLDYLAHDIRAVHCVDGRGSGVFYFPILSDHANFVGQMRRWFPDLDTNAPDLWNYLESIQSYHGPKSEWLSLFNKVNSQNKHQELVVQMVTRTETVQVDTQDGGQVRWNPAGVRFGPGVSIGGVPVDPRTQMPVPSATQKVTRIAWVDFRFADVDVSALELLSKSYEGIRHIALTVRQWL